MSNEDIKQVIGEQIDFEITRLANEGVRKEWGAEYTEGYIDGLKQALDSLTEGDQK